MPGPAKIFETIIEDDVLIIVPYGPARNFPYREVHMAANDVLKQALENVRIRNIIADVRNVSAIDSVMMDCLLRVLTLAKRRNGVAGFCNVPQTIRDALVRARMGEVWAEFSSREEALRQLRQNAAQ